MHKLLMIAIAAGGAFAATDSIVIRETGGSAQADRPVTIGRFFAAGEIANYPKPAVAGVSLAAWQADVKTRHRDGVRACVVTGATNASPVTVACQSPHGYQEGEQVLIGGVAGNTAANGTWYVTPLSSTTFSLHGSTGNGAYSAGGIATGPDDGSVAFAILSFRTTLAANAQTAINFVNDTNPCSAGSAAQCLTAAVTKAQLQNWDTGAGPGMWGATMDLVNGAAQTVDAKAILNACSVISADIASLTCRYWAYGPVASIVIVEDRTPGRAFDAGFTALKPIHPIFVITAYTGFKGLKIDYALENVWAGNTVPAGVQMRDETYQVIMKKGSPLSPFYTYPSIGTFTHYARTRFRQPNVWQGTAPGPVWIDHNFAYLISTGILPNYDQSFALPLSMYDPANSGGHSAYGGFSDVYLFNHSDGGKDPNSAALFQKAMGTGGSRGEIGPDTEWDIAYMYAWSAGLTSANARLMEAVREGSAEVAGHVPIHYRENIPTAGYCQSTKNCIAAGVGAADAYGRPLSIDARPHVWTYSPGGENVYSGTNGIPVAGLAASGWAYKSSHAWDAVWISYLVTGDWYYLEEMQSWASYMLAEKEPDSGYFFTTRMMQYGRVFDELRGHAWSMRQLFHAAIMSPVGTPERLYFREKLDNNLAIDEGVYGMTDGVFYEPQTTVPKTRWDIGRSLIAGGKPNPLSMMQLGGECYNPDNAMDGTKMYSSQQPWSYWFNVIVQSSIADAGFTEARPVVQHFLKKNLLHKLADPDYNPFLVTVYYDPVKAGSFAGCNTALLPATDFFTTWAAVKDSFAAGMQTKSSFGPLAPYNLSETVYEIAPGGDSYGLITIAAASYLPGLTDGSLDGAAAYQWLKSNIPAATQAYNALYPKWGIVSRTGSSAGPTCDLNGDGAIDIYDLMIAVEDALALLPCGGTGPCSNVDVQLLTQSIVQGRCLR
jgi:hypothetical protein